MAIELKYSQSVSSPSSRSRGSIHYHPSSPPKGQYTLTVADFGINWLVATHKNGISDAMRTYFNGKTTISIEIICTAPGILPKAECSE
ncbi:hypothetical protein DSCA_35950 [Desulfosarcina alkanivorans]|uniref:Uncharacterized protein n=1 Tax=Desulfosarcina alkanivorans TaxID=571177 RepID=A0A5K7YMR0_9BACT|nr:hypothetical protein DSCA_35950 [Desulfosarcina alkanivorans]